MLFGFARLSSCLLLAGEGYVSKLVRTHRGTSDSLVVSEP